MKMVDLSILASGVGIGLTIERPGHGILIEMFCQMECKYD